MRTAPCVAPGNGDEMTNPNPKARDHHALVRRLGSDGKYVVRSMSTSDWNGRDPVVPYHIYLLPPTERAGAYWASYFRAQLFDTPQAAEAEARRSLKSDYWNWDVVPANHESCPDFWELRDM